MRNEFLPKGSFLIPHSLVPLLLSPRPCDSAPGSGALPLRLPLLLSELYDSLLVLDLAVTHCVWKHGKETLLPYLLVYKTLKELGIYVFINRLSYVVFTV